MQVPDEIIRRLMLEAGYVPGTSLTDPVLRRYSEALAEYVRRQDAQPEAD